VDRAVFGWTGEELPLAGQGTWMIEQDPRRSAIEALQLGIDLGLRIVDTAEMYGNGRAEHITGEALKGRRERAFVVSKVLPSNAGYDGTRRACERSLERLGIDRLDLYLLHWPGSLPIAETMRGLESLVRDGLTRHIGVSNFDVEELDGARKALRHERLACNQVLYHLGDRGIELRLIPHCEKLGIAVMGYSPFGHGKISRGKGALIHCGAARQDTTAGCASFSQPERSFCDSEIRKPGACSRKRGSARLAVDGRRRSRD